MRRNRSNFFLWHEKTATFFFATNKNKLQQRTCTSHYSGGHNISSRHEERLSDWPCRKRPCRAHFHASTGWFPVRRCRHCMIQTLRCRHDRLTGRRYDQDDLLQADNNTTSKRSSPELTNFFRGCFSPIPSDAFRLLPSIPFPFLFFASPSFVAAK